MGLALLISCCSSTTAWRHSVCGLVSDPPERARSQIFFWKPIPNTSFWSFKEVHLFNYLSLVWLECQKSRCLQPVTKYTATRETGTAFQVTAWNILNRSRQECRLLPAEELWCCMEYESQYSGFHRKKTDHFPTFKRPQQSQDHKLWVLSWSHAFTWNYIALISKTR